MKDHEFIRLHDHILNRPICLRRTSLTVPMYEYERVARIDHPNILAIYEVRRDDLLTEAVAGTRLSDFLNIPGDRRAFTARFQEMLIEPLLSGLSYAHSRGVVHGFLHPGNVWLFPRDELKIWGFGFSRLEADRSDPGWEFAAPPARRGDKPTVATDIWSVGSLLHLLYCGRLPGEKADDSVPEWVQGCLSGRFLSMHDLLNFLFPVTRLEMDPSEVSILHTTLANNYFRQFKVELAVLEWEKALAACPEDRVARNNLGVALWGWGRVQEAADCFRRAGTVFNLGLLLLDQGQFEGALEHLRKSTVLNPSRFSGYLALGECLLGLGKLPQAIDEFFKALILNVQSARTLRGLAQAYERLGRTQDAAQYREKSQEATDQEVDLQPLILETPLG